MRRFAIALLASIAVCGITADLWTRRSYETQFRDFPDARPSAQFPLGTDALGRDRLTRLVYGTRVSLSLAPAAAGFSCVLAALLGGTAGWAGGFAESAIMASADLFLSVPWMFLLLMVRAWLPLNVSPEVSVGITFALLGALGWAAPARVVRAAVKKLRASDFMLLAEAHGATRWRLLRRHLIPNVTPILLAQFWIAVPAFILAETTLGMLGLGISEPLPSWGGLLREIEGGDALSNWWLLAPAVVLAVVTASLQLLRPKKELAS